MSRLPYNVDRLGVPTPIGEPSYWSTTRWRGEGSILSAYLHADTVNVLCNEFQELQTAYYHSAVGL